MYRLQKFVIPICFRNCDYFLIINLTCLKEKNLNCVPVYFSTLSCLYFFRVEFNAPAKFIVLLKLNSVALVREQIIPTHRPTLVGEVSVNFCG
jgi:hypothetical protein